MKELPQDNSVINFIWIGNKPLPDAELKTLLDYALPAILPVVLWVDHPERIKQQLLDKDPDTIRE
jgi:hypothetical protein